MGPDVMGPGMMGPGMMGPGWGGPQGYGLSAECQKYYDETAGRRKELNNKRFEYIEAIKNLKTKSEDLSKLEKTISMVKG